MRILVTICFLFFSALLSLADSKVVKIDAGPLRLEVHVSRTAHQFYVVDQMSCWDYFCHEQYARNLGPLTVADQAMLLKHCTVRKAHPWGSGLEKTFYCDRDVESAIRNGIENGWISQAEGQIELEVINHFSSKVDKLLETQNDIVRTFVERLQRDVPKLSDVALRLQRFTGVTPAPLPVFLFITPSDFDMGGGCNGGILTLEIPRVGDPYFTLLHEAFHAYFVPLKSSLARYTSGVDGLDPQTLEEGIVHAFVPGIIHIEGSDPIVSDIRNGISQHKTIRDPLTRYYRFALALRPLLKTALNEEKQTIQEFLPIAVHIWRSTYEFASVLNK